MGEESGWAVRAAPFGEPNRRRLMARDPDAARVVELVARQRHVPIDMLLDRGRPAEIAAARQLAMYLLNVVLGRHLAEVGEIFGRDRTTASYSCARIEDRRDDPDFDAEVSRLEEIIAGSGAGAQRAAG